MNTSSQSTDTVIALKILDEINQENAITQRTISGRLDIALGLVNVYIKRLAKKGHIKITKGPMNRVKYALTPKGFAHRVDLTYSYMQSSINYLRDVRTQIDNIYVQMIEAGVKNILLWGDGEIAELSYISMRGLTQNLIGVIDGKKEDKGFFGYNIYSFEDVVNLEYDAILIASFGNTDAQKIEDLGIAREKVYLL